MSNDSTGRESGGIEHDLKAISTCDHDLLSAGLNGWECAICGVPVEVDTEKIMARLTVGELDERR